VSGGRLLVTEVMGSNLRTREAISLGESELRRFTDIIEAGNTAGWHTFEQSLVKAYEDELITEESAMLYCVNKPQMHQRLDVVNKRREKGPSTTTLKMKPVEPKPQPPSPPPAPLISPATPTSSSPPGVVKR
jgi:twitching motility protein PilT